MPFFFSILPLANFFFYLRSFANYTCLELLISGRSNSLTRFADQLVGQEVPKTRENLRGLSNWDVMRGDHRVIELIRPRRPLLSMVIVSLLDRFWTNKDREREYFFPKFVKNSSKESIIDLNLWSFDKSIIIEYFYEIKIRKRVETNYKKKKNSMSIFLFQIEILNTIKHYTYWLACIEGWCFCTRMSRALIKHRMDE